MGEIKQGLFLCLLALAAATSDISDSDLKELETILEFLEFDFEDQCIRRTNSLHQFYSGGASDLAEFTETEKNFAQKHKNELENLKKYKNYDWSAKNYKRVLDIMFTAGPMMLESETFTEYLTFGTSTVIAKTKPDEVNNVTVSQVQKILGTEKNETRLADVWTKWITHVQNSSRDVTQQISLLQLEAEANGHDSVESYWLSVSELKKLDYKGADTLWNSIIPLYNNLRQYIVKHMVSRFGQNVIKNLRNIPIHALGSLDSGDWVTVAESLGALKESTTYNNLFNSLKNKTTKQIYQAADEITAELRLNYLHPDFEKYSQYEGENNNCIHYTEEKCKNEFIPKTWNCKTDGVSIKSFLNAHKEVAHIKQISQVETSEVGYLRRQGPRDSVLYEAISTATALLSLQPESLKRRGFITTIDQDANITSLLLTALYIIPPMPLHLSYDVWRLNVLKALDPEEDATSPNITTPDSVTNSSVDAEVTDELYLYNSTESANVTIESGFQYTRENVTTEWWTVRERIQGVGSPAFRILEDYLLDERVIWNKPHLRQLLRKGKTEPWESIVEDLFNITELNTAPLVNYFKPLVTFLESGAKFKTSSYSGSELNFFLKESSLGHGTKKNVNNASEDSNALLIVLAGLAVIGSVAAVISVIRRKMKKRRLDRIRRRNRHTAL